MDSVNSKNIWFILLFLFVLASAFGVVQIIGETDHTSIYTVLFDEDK